MGLKQNKNLHLLQRIITVLGVLEVFCPFFVVVVVRIVVSGGSPFMSVRNLQTENFSHN